jgi:hypothetical protein
MEKNESVYDRFDADQAVFAAGGLWETSEYLVPCNRAIDDDVSDVNTLGCIFLSYRLRESPKPRLRRVEGPVGRSPAERSASTRKMDCSCLIRQHSANRLSTEQKTAEANDPPALFKISGLHIDDFPGGVVASVVDRQVYFAARGIKQLDDVAFARGIGYNRNPFPPSRAISFAIASMVDFVRPATITRKPSAANRLDNCAPSPSFGPTPITTAVFIRASIL